VDTWWQTETGAIMISGLPGVSTMKPGFAGTPLPGISATVLDESGKEVKEGSGLGGSSATLPRDARWDT
jgi:acetyl-CoA synthetase